MQEYTLEIKLLSDTAFSMGSGISSMLDSEIQHDSRGLPRVSGRALKGLLVNECSEILYVLPEESKSEWTKAAQRLFGSHGNLTDEGILHIGDAGIAPDLAAYLADEDKLSREDIIYSLTDIRYQTAINEKGAPKDESLRSIQVLINGITLYAPLIFTEEPGEKEKALLAASTSSLRRAGLGRTRGKGKISVKITDRLLEAKKFAESESKTTDIQSEWLKIFKKEVTG